MTEQEFTGIIPLFEAYQRGDPVYIIDHDGTLLPIIKLEEEE